MTIAVTGSTGRLGGRVARLLAGRGVPQRLLVRDLAKAPSLAGATVVRASYGDPETALEGVRVLFMISGEEAPDRVEQHKSFVDSAVRAGVDHIVYTSFFGAAPDATFTLARDHWATEEHLRSSGVTWTVLRDNLYADFFRYMVGEDGVIRGPAGDGRVSAVALDDIAEAAVAVLLDPQPHSGKLYHLTGPQALSFDEIAAALSATYVNETVAEAYASRAKYQAPGWQVDAWVSTYTAIARGEMSDVSTDVEYLTGRPATSLDRLLERDR